MSELELYRRDITKAGGNTNEVDSLVEDILKVSTPPELQALLQQLDTQASRLDCFRDCDYAAVAVQFAAERALNAATRRRLLEFALARARWFASCATAGGEGLARSVHVRELVELLGNAA
ncbi:hypothetical protein [Polaromonas sp.]|uniref:hypothetical protein n=1 Tax=Polaromonas sp. TaxID=1869339 RepID=UPI003263B08D